MTLAVFLLANLQNAEVAIFKKLIKSIHNCTRLLTLESFLCWHSFHTYRQHSLFFISMNYCDALNLQSKLLFNISQNPQRI